MDHILKNISTNNLTIGVVGIGRIGLPTALCFAEKGFLTIGIDINTKLVDEINSGVYPLKDEPELIKFLKKLLQIINFLVQMMFHHHYVNVI